MLHQAILDTPFLIHRSLRAACPSVSYLFSCRLRRCESKHARFVAGSYFHCMASELSTFNFILHHFRKGLKSIYSEIGTKQLLKWAHCEALKTPGIFQFMVLCFLQSALLFGGILHTEKEMHSVNLSHWFVVYIACFVALQYSNRWCWYLCALYIHSYYILCVFAHKLPTWFQTASVQIDRGPLNGESVLAKSSARQGD